jgi:hypothetical protein
MGCPEMLRIFCLGIGEVVEFALDPITLAVALHRVNRVVVGRLRLKAGHEYADNRIGTLAVQLDGRLTPSRSRCFGYQGVVKFLIGLVTPSLSPLGSIDSTL